ncbi:MAG: NAD(P)-dependent methylenetetrahydromethanopterin dehydrogenase [Gammaproteobacteria bacterium]
MAQRILYFLVPGNNVSPFDVTIAADAGFDQVIPLTGVQPEQVTAIVQDAIFCRPPKRYNDTGIFIGGRDVHLAADMFRIAARAMVDDFRVGVFADPNGAYTTSASVIALVERALLARAGTGFEGRSVAVFGAGPVGLCTAVLAAKQGAQARLCQLTADDDERVALRFCERYGATVEWTPALSQREKRQILGRAEVAVCAAKAGVRILDAELLDGADRLQVVADTNAVPPSGIDGVGAQDRETLVQRGKASFLSIGPLAIGNLKYKTQFALYRAIQTSPEPALLDFPDAFRCASEELAKSDAVPVAA